MDKFKYLIVGGGIAGVTAAETIRGKDPEGSIAIISDEDHPLYSRVMLSKPNFFLGKVPFDRIWMKKSEWYGTNRITFLGGRTAAALDGAAKKIKLENGDTIEYEKLLLALGVRPNRLGVPGSERKGIYGLRTIEEGKAIMEAIKTAKHGLVVGGGFIGLEMADLLKLAGLETTMVIREPYLWKPILDEPSGRILERALEKGGVKMLRERTVKEVKGAPGNDVTVGSVVLDDGTALPADMIICGIGAHCELEWLKSSGIAVNRGIIADDRLATNLPDVWTAGDVAEYRDNVLDERLELGNWVNAGEQGRVTALNMVGETTLFNFVSFYTTQAFGASIAFVGDVRLGPDRIVIPRGTPESGSYGRIIVLDKGARKEVEGATLVNRLNEMSTVAKLIQLNLDVSKKFAQLGDPNVDLKTLL